VRPVTTGRTALVIGGTGPTGPFVVTGLEQRGFAVTMLHTGRHELPELMHLEHLHTSPHDIDQLSAAVGGRSWDVVVATYGRLRDIAALFAARCDQFVSVGGAPVYRGFFDADRWQPPGLPVPTAEDAPTSEEADDGKSYRIRRTEELLFERIPRAAHFRYPLVYGPRQPAPREWSIVRRALDGRPHIVVPDGGLTLMAAGYVENLAHAVLLAVDHPDAAAGQVFNAADEENLTIAQIVDLVAEELGHRWEVVSMPWDLAVPARPLVQQHRTTHRVLDVGKLRARLGYRDLVPARLAVRRTARWLAEHRPEPGGIEERILEDPFDYANEDRLVASWKAALATVVMPDWPEQPGLGVAYGGPGTSRVRPDTRI
jgi:nucleoside-diphosphate-sugar epimerase